MTGPGWLEAAKFAMEIIEKERSGLVTRAQAVELLERIGFGGLIAKGEHK